MALRDSIYEQFGPLILEALVDNLLEEINELRTALGKPPRTKEGFLGSTNNHLDHLPEYNWMSNGE